MELKNIVIYGELFGGWYPSDEQAKTWTGAQGVRLDRDGRCLLKSDAERAIQEGVYYSSAIEFCAFDLAVQTDLQYQFCTYRKTLLLFSKVHLFHSMPLKIGKLHQVSDYSPIFDSTIPLLLHMTPLPVGTNYAEGVVIRALDDINHDAIYKLKHPQFREIPVVFSGKKTPCESGTVGLVLSYANINRYNSVLSKFGRKTSREILLKEFINDTLNDFYENHPTIILDYKRLIEILTEKFNDIHQKN
ncbi:MAG: hypothetical protein A3D92_08930 [Bacteroidetes bacterium RIFCSPHIGHO2_02_FULL_44_7]|nr:MAG: hypothetical protein A3D92_08930 [Bacteroidetes bacterium RIFCSPHIGHO2_02_FULL_44_7]